ncbi:hypothetical protein [Clostridium scatologenes]|uniref:Uncharacterized protein n=1 Tax=Clostridium scatologenes TaxID=1548 RepID=A0A0E3K288_CLOSL|nr:hypothetical protein [Clostridium scatologenes]AKA70568.1 hypothetical protein CSCA_3443 [Clostridium scatologenes]
MDTSTEDYKNFKAALDRAQGKLYTDCINKIDELLNVESEPPTEEFLLNAAINLNDYPRIVNYKHL